MPNRNGPIGVMDSGMGGFSVAREILRHLPDESITYFGDTAHLPYGPRPAAEVRGFVLNICEFFEKQGCKMAIIACNTATVAGEEAARQAFPAMPILGMLQPAVALAVRTSPDGRIGVVGTKGTIDSGQFERAILELSSTAHVTSQPCEELLRLAEQGGGDRAVLLSLARRDLEPMFAAQVDTLVLACTDFTCIRDVLDEVIQGRMSVIDPAEAVAVEAGHQLEGLGLLAGPGRPVYEFYTSDDRVPQFAEFGSQFMGIEIHTVRQGASV